MARIKAVAALVCLGLVGGCQSSCFSGGAGTGSSGGTGVGDLMGGGAGPAATTNLPCRHNCQGNAYYVLPKGSGLAPIYLQPRENASLQAMVAGGPAAGRGAVQLHGVVRNGQVEFTRDAAPARGDEAVMEMAVPQGADGTHAAAVRVVVTPEAQRLLTEKAGQR